MKLDPSKRDLAKLAAALKRLQSFRAGQDFAPDTAKDLKAGRLEDYDLVELVVRDYEDALVGREDVRPVWEHSRALLAVIDEMDAAGVKSDKTATVKKSLTAWKLS